jgi:hypothetical protein
MALDKEKVQDLIDDFVINNVEQINDVATENPVLYDAVIDALNLLSKKFGTLQSVNVPKPAAPKANALNPIVEEGAIFIDIKDNETKVEKINFQEEIVTFIRVDNKSPIKLKFSVVNDAIEKGGIKLKEKPLNPLVKVGAQFEDKDNSGNPLVTILEIDYDAQAVKFIRENYPNEIAYSFKVVNDIIEDGFWVPIQQAAPQTQSNIKALNALVDVGAKFKDKTSAYPDVTIEDIDYDYENVTFSREGKLKQYTFGFEQINERIDNGFWEPIQQAPSGVQITLNPSVQVGQTYLDLDDDSNFSVLAINEYKQIVVINWNEDDIEADVDFEDFNDNLQAATWVLAPDKAQSVTTEADILEAIEGLELIGDAESKKEIAELKKQLKQLKKKKP